jgi:hypothetical protein
MEKYGDNMGITPSTIFSWSYLQQLCNVPEPELGQWWWVYAPWLKEILSSGCESIAYLICLGYHVRVTDGEIQRSWLHFLPSDVSEDAKRRHLIACHVGHVLRNPERDKILLRTTQLLEYVDPTQYLRPLLVSFDDENDGAFSDWIYKTYKTNESRSPLYCLNWTVLRRTLSKDQVCGCLHGDDIELVCGTNGDEWRLIDLTQQPDPDGADLMFQNIVMSNGTNLSSVKLDHLGPDDTASALSRVTPIDKIELLKLCNFVAWTHALAPPNEWSHILTIPLWLPPNELSARDGTAILYLRPSALQAPKEEKCHADWRHNTLGNVLGCTSAVFAGSGFMAYDRSRSLQRTYGRVPLLSSLADTLQSHIYQGESCQRVVFLTKAMLLVYVEIDGVSHLDPWPFAHRKGWNYFLTIAQNPNGRYYWWQLRGELSAPVLKQEASKEALKAEDKIEHLNNLFCAGQSQADGPFKCIMDRIDEGEFELSTDAHELIDAVENLKNGKVLSPSFAGKICGYLRQLADIESKNGDVDESKARAGEVVESIMQSVYQEIKFAKRKKSEKRGPARTEKDKMRKIFTDITLRQTGNKSEQANLGTASLTLLEHLEELGSALYREEDRNSGHTYISYSDVPPSKRFIIISVPS